MAKEASELTRERLAQLIDYTQVRAYACQADVAALCDEAVRLGLRAVTINPAWTSYCAKRLAGTAVLINPTIGFPLGANSAHVKVEEARDAIRSGAAELDMVINVGALKSGFPEFVEREIAAVVKVSAGKPVKVILETCYLDEGEKTAVCEMSIRAGAAFVKTSTGFGSAGAKAEDVALMRGVVGDALGVKAAGGIRSYRDAAVMIQAGAIRIGTSAAQEILAEAPEEAA